jgi:hypothetical protein
MEHYWVEKEVICTDCNGSKEVIHPFWAEYDKLLDEGHDECSARNMAYSKYESYCASFESGQTDIPLHSLNYMYPRGTIVACLTCNSTGSFLSKVSLAEALAAIVKISTEAVASPSAAAVDTTDDLKGTITASGENAPNEGKEKAFDNQAATKWLNFSAQSWIQYSYAAGIAGRLTGYTLTSGDDAPERDPADFLLAGSNDGGKSWTTLDTRTGISFSARQQKQLFTLGTPATFKAYRLPVNRVAGVAGGLIQISAIELLGQQVQSQ